MKWEEAREFKVNKRFFSFLIVQEQYTEITEYKLINCQIGKRERKKTERDLQRTKEGQTETGGRKTDKQTLGERKVQQN